MSRAAYVPNSGLRLKSRLSWIVCPVAKQVAKQKARHEPGFRCCVGRLRLRFLEPKVRRLSWNDSSLFCRGAAMAATASAAARVRRKGGKTSIGVVDCNGSYTCFYIRLLKVAATIGIAVTRIGVSGCVVLARC